MGQAPAQLVAQHLEKLVVDEPHKAHGIVAAADQYPVFRPDVTTGAAIDHHHQPLWRGRKYGDRLMVAEHQGPRRQGVGRNWRQLEHRAIGADHRAAGAEGVGGGARGSRENHAVGGNVHRGMATDGNLEMAHARERFPVQGHFVEAQHFPAPLIAPHHAHDQHRALFHGPVTGQDLIQGLVQVVQVGLGQKPQVAGIDRENGYANRRCLAGRREHRAIAAQHHG